jgi:hypothetical protein
MSCYASIDEEKIRTQSRVREWTRSGFLDAGQSERISEGLHVDLRRTNPFLRAVLFVFTVLIAAASIALFATTFHINDNGPIALTCLVSSGICYALAEYLMRRFRLYRFGVEEALAVCAVLLFAIAAIAVTDRLIERNTFERTVVAALSAGGIGALAVYWRFGYLYAVIAFVSCLAALPFQFHLTLPVERGLVALIILGTLFIARSKRRVYGDDFPGDDYGWIQAAALAGLYVDLNLQLSGSATAGSFYWFTYALVWIIPIVALVLALRDRDHPLLDVSLAAVLVTVLTNKPYLGLVQRPWDPIIFGVLVSAIAILIKRWLAKSPDQARYGFTAQRLLTADRRLLTIVGTATTVLQSGSSGIASHAAAPAASKPEFQGGRSGGAGASGSF